MEPRYPFDAGEFAEIERIAREILQRWPPAEWFPLGLGRSPTPVLRYLMETGHDTAQIAMSGGKMWPDPGTDAAFEAVLFDHFDRHLAPIVDAPTVGGRRLLLIDYVQSGAALLKGHDYIADWCARTGRDRQFDCTGWIEPHTNPNGPPVVVSSRGHDLFALTDPTMQMNALLEKYDRWAAVSQFLIRPGGDTARPSHQVLTRRPNYDHLGATIREWLESAGERERR